MLEIASELYYREGINAVGVDRIAAEADASKATLYAHYGNKDGLVAAYLDQRSARSREQITRNTAGTANARERLLQIFNALGDWYAADDFRGCHFINAGSELTDPEHPAVSVMRRHRIWVKRPSEVLAGDLGAQDPGILAAQLLMLHDGATVAADLDGDPTAARAVRDAAERLIVSSTN